MDLVGESNSTSGWGPVAGVKYGDNEEDILRLGSPTNVSIKDATKTIKYTDIGLSFYLTKGKVYMVVYKSPTNGTAAIIYRYIHALIP